MKEVGQVEPVPAFGDLQQQRVHRATVSADVATRYDGDRTVEGSLVDDDSDLDVGLDGIAEVDDEEVIEHAPEADRAEVARLAARVRRHARDQDLYAAVRAQGFCGRDWDKLVDALAQYGLAVMEAWMRTSYVFAKVNKIGRPLPHSDTESRELRENEDLRAELGAETVARALKYFRDAAVTDGPKAWRPDGGANLTTYFVGACVQAFNNEFRRWQRNEQHWGLNDFADPAGLTKLEKNEDLARQVHMFADPDRAAGDTEHMDRVLGELNAKERAIVLLTDWGYAQVEIGELLDMSDRAVEGTLHRLRKKDIRGQIEGARDA